MTLQALDDVIDRYTGRQRIVLDYSRITRDLVSAAKQPDFSVDDWQPLADIIATDVFVRVGNFKEVMDWQQYRQFLTDWAKAAEWDCSFQRITEAGGRVFYELEERSVMGTFTSAVNSLSVYEFDDQNRITRIDVYLQMELDPAMLGSFTDATQ